MVPVGFFVVTHRRQLALRYRDSDKIIQTIELLGAVIKHMNPEPDQTSHDTQ